MKPTLCLLLIITGLFLGGCESSVVPDPSTTITFSIPFQSNVKLTVENSYHTTIAVLIDRELAAGYYSTLFDAQNLPEGIYFYTIEAKGIEKDYYYKSTKTMVLVK